MQKGKVIGGIVLITIGGMVLFTPIGTHSIMSAYSLLCSEAWDYGPGSGCGHLKGISAILYTLIIIGIVLVIVGAIQKPKVKTPKTF